MKLLRTPFAGSLLLASIICLTTSTNHGFLIPFHARLADVFARSMLANKEYQTCYISNHDFD